MRLHQCMQMRPTRSWRCLSCKRRLMISEGVHQYRLAPQDWITTRIFDRCWFVGCYLHGFVHIVVCMNSHWPLPCRRMPPRTCSFLSFSNSAVSCLHSVNGDFRGRGHSCAGCRVHVGNSRRRVPAPFLRACAEPAATQQLQHSGC